jgi:hypothetical protein
LNARGLTGRIELTSVTADLLAEAFIMNASDKENIESIIQRLNGNKLNVFEVPARYSTVKEILTAERDLNLIQHQHRGYDIIRDCFFVEEAVHKYFSPNEWTPLRTLRFQTFEEYLEYLKGDIYNDACYTYWHPTDEIIEKYHLDIDKLMSRKAFVEDRINDKLPAISEADIFAYKEAEKTYKKCQTWIRKFNACSTSDEFQRIVDKYSNSQFRWSVKQDFFIYNYIFADIGSMDRFHAVMDCISAEKISNSVLYSLCSIYDPDEILSAYHPKGSKTSVRNKVKLLKDYIQQLKDGKVTFRRHGFFDDRTHYYIEEEDSYLESSKYSVSKLLRIFPSFDEFLRYRNDDLTHCDLHYATQLDYDFSRCKTDESTRLPLTQKRIDEAEYKVTKEFWKGKFRVNQNWIDSNGSSIKENCRTFTYLFDFVSYLGGDLNGANLIMCDGLDHLHGDEDIDFSGAKLRSSVCRKFRIPFQPVVLHENLIGQFSSVEENEKQTQLQLTEPRKLDITFVTEKDKNPNTVNYDMYSQRIFYISDLHLLHRLQNAHCESAEDITSTILHIAESIASKARGMLIINGDVSSDFSIFQAFVKALRNMIFWDTVVVFTLGNHEFWNFEGKNIDEIIKIYRDFLTKNGMYLLQNDLLFRTETSRGVGLDPQKSVHIIPSSELLTIDEKTLSDRLRNARTVIWGGTGFSGLNEKFNANVGVYRKTISRDEEIRQSKIFSMTYLKLLPVLKTKHSIVMTHMPLEDWCESPAPQEDIFYTSGHTHRNEFFDDGTYHIYCDNQIGYHTESIQLKSFLMDNEYDLFNDYQDGIYEITLQQYQDFYRGKNIQMNFSRDVAHLWMLKKVGFYCFITESSIGSLCILNGGSRKALDHTDLKYYFNNMDRMVAAINTPLAKYTGIQRQIASYIKVIGGEGRIHGCIIDIDELNHVYVNPFDLTVTGYFAWDIINKKAYPSIPSLLEKHCHELYVNYNKLLSTEEKNAIAVLNNRNIPEEGQVYLDTSMYKASREIKKMQRLNSNILGAWYDNVLHEHAEIDQHFPQIETNN